MEGFQIYLTELGIADKVLITGYVSDKELIWLYQNCFAHLYPSLFEGFGLPVLEGMQFGAPTLASASTSIPEVAGKGAILLPPEDVGAWVKSMLSLAGNEVERDRLTILAREQSSRFDWHYNASALLDLYEEALASPKRNVL